MFLIYFYSESVVYSSDISFIVVSSSVVKFPFTLIFSNDNFVTPSGIANSTSNPPDFSSLLTSTSTTNFSILSTIARGPNSLIFATSVDKLLILTPFFGVPLGRRESGTSLLYSSTFTCTCAVAGSIKTSNLFNSRSSTRIFACCSRNRLSLLRLLLLLLHNLYFPQYS